MSYSQKPLIELLKSGRFPGETKKPQHIETVISNVFIFPEKVYKVYKNDNDFFNKGFRDISNKSARFLFTMRDFDWNHTLSPSLYLKVVGVVVKDDTVAEVTAHDTAEELMIVMKRVDTRDVLFEKLVDNEITEEDAYSIGKQFGETIKKIQKKLSGNETYYKIFESRISDLRDWIKSVEDKVSIEESGTYCDFMKSFIDRNRSKFENQLTRETTNDGDIHCYNALYSNGTLYLMDTFPPKEDWLKGHPYIAFYRMGVDIWALTGKKELFEAYTKGYESVRGVIDRSYEPLYVLYVSGIQVSYLYMLARTHPIKNEKAAITFHTFVRDYYRKVK